MGYIEFSGFKAYKNYKRFSYISWRIYVKMGWQDKKIIDDQFIRSVDSVGVNIAEGYGRYYYLDRVRFYFNARASLLESKHRAGLLKEKKYTSLIIYDELLKIYNQILLGICGLIKLNNKNKRIF